MFISLKTFIETCSTSYPSIRQLQPRKKSFKAKNDVEKRTNWWFLWDCWWGCLCLFFVRCFFFDVGLFTKVFGFWFGKQQQQQLEPVFPVHHFIYKIMPHLSFTSLVISILCNTQASQCFEAKCWGERCFQYKHQNPFIG